MLGNKYCGFGKIWPGNNVLTSVRSTGQSLDLGLPARSRDRDRERRSLTPQRNPKRLRSVVLAYVMAYEMGHLLLGSAKHGDVGIMTSSFGLNAIRQPC